MDYERFNQLMATCKGSENDGAFSTALQCYKSVEENSLTGDQRVIVLLGKATCHLRANQPRAALDVLDQQPEADLNITVQAMCLILKSGSCDFLGFYEQSLEYADQALECISGLDKDLEQEAKAQRAFALFSLGDLASAENILQGLELTNMSEDLVVSIKLYLQACADRSTHIYVQ